MKTLKLTFFGAAVVLVTCALAIFLASSPVQVQAQQPAVVVHFQLRPDPLARYD